MLSILDSVERYLQTKSLLWSKTSIISTRSRLRRCLAISKDLDPSEIFKTLTHCQNKLYSIKTTLIVASSFERFLKKNSHRIEDFLKENAFRFRNAYQDKTVRMTDEQFKKISTRSKPPASHNLLVLLGQCGLRKAEALKAEWKDFDGKKMELKVIGKGGKIRRVPLHPRWLKKSKGPLIVSQSLNASRRFISKSKFGFHDFRSYFATKIVNHKELNIKDAQMLLGHSSIETTMRYLRVDEEKVSRILLKG